MTCPADAELSYYKYLEGQIVDRKEFTASVGTFSKSFEHGLIYNRLQFFH